MEACLGYGARPVMGQVHGEPLAAQVAGHHVGQVGLVVHDEHMQRLGHQRSFMGGLRVSLPAGLLARRPVDAVALECSTGGRVLLLVELAGGEAAVQDLAGGLDR